MSAATPILLALAGLALLTVGAEALVRGAASVARLARVTPAVIGLTIVAMGTSFPELTVSVVAALGDRPDVAVGNVVGSNIVNVAVIAGVAALILPLPVQGTTVKLEWPFMFVASVVGLLLARDGAIDRLEGGFFLVALALFVAYALRLARREVTAREAQQFAQAVAALEVRTRRAAAIVDVGLIVGGLALMGLGGRWLVNGAVELARVAGVTDRVIALTLVAGGTSLPELATSIVAALRRQTEIAIGNLIGSNIFNLLGILGVVALLAPVPVSPALVAVDMWWMVAFALLLFPILRSGFRISRWEGVLLLGAYAVYLVVLL